MTIHDLESREPAWTALGAARAHPQVRQWLAESGGPPARRGRMIFRATAASVALIAGAGLYGYLAVGPARYSTGIGEQRDVMLEDGSLMTLNTDTAVTVRYSDSTRHIHLERGEALFAVRKDRARPFDVTAGATRTRALGTEFNVDLRQRGVTVSVLDGAVRVSANEGTVAMLAKGQAVEIAAAAREPRQMLHMADRKRIDAWRTRKLEFSDTALTSAIEEYNRYSATRIVIGTPELEAVRVSGVFRIGDLDAFLYSLREALGVQTHELKDEVILLLPMAEHIDGGGQRPR